VLSPTEPIARAPVYPVSLSAHYPEQQSRWKALLRLPLSVPVWLFSAILGYVLYGSVMVMWVAVLVRGRIPRWLFDAVVAANRALARARGYVLLLTDAYPPFDGPHDIQYDVTYPERTSRWRLVIWKVLTAIPHLIVVQALNFAVLAVLPIAWVAILISGRYPRGLHTFVTGVVRWERRVEAYLLSLTDEFPPFSFAQDAGPAGRSTYLVNAVIGPLLMAGAIGGVVALVIFGSHQQTTVEVSYQDLLAGRTTISETTVLGNALVISLNGAEDPADATVSFLVARQDYHFVRFQMSVTDQRRRRLGFNERDFELKDSGGKHHRPFLVLVNGRTLPSSISKGDTGTVELIFEVADARTPKELGYSAHGYLRPVVYKFR
jgi:hypothetical protein